MRLRACLKSCRFSNNNWTIFEQSPLTGNFSNVHKIFFIRFPFVIFESICKLMSHLRHLRCAIFTIIIRYQVITPYIFC
ncbi:unnamed protein product [Moneuplotes crassus]|uniref:Uncharacterized protein n=1 Tax=Euplotes crassus TaxID=5936 RepID=A0AAD1YA00_EUPCR|nr:unnamed protein product [Moneuplotes crassus]